MGTLTGRAAHLEFIESDFFLESVFTTYAFLFN